MARPEYKARIKNGVLEILPFVEKKKNKTGGTDVTVFALDPITEAKYKQIILNNLGAGVAVEDLEVEVE